MKVVFSTPDWTISGVNSFNHNLMRGLRSVGYDVELLVIPISGTGQGLPLPTDVPVKHLEFDIREGFFTARWNALIRYLNGQAPCIYLPGYDYNHSCVAPCLSNEVGIVGVVHSDDPWHYEHMIRLGRYWNAVVGVSEFLHRRMVEIEPGVAPRSSTIHYGVSCPVGLPERPAGVRPLRILYTGRFTEEQKRVSDLAKIAHALARRGVPAEWTLIGAGAQDGELRAGFASLAPPGRATFTGPLSADAVLARYGEQDCLVLTSSYEGLPLSLLEAMAHGTIPVVTAVESGIPELVRHGENGFALPVGDVEAFADCLAGLQADPARRQTLHRAAFEEIAQGRFSIDAVTQHYAALFEQVRRAIADGSYARPRPYRPGSLTGDILPPPHLQFAPDLYYELKATLEAWQRLLGPLQTPVRSMLHAYLRRPGWLRRRAPQPLAER